MSASTHTHIQQPYSRSFVAKNTLGVVADDLTFNILLAALTTDQVRNALHVFHKYYNCQKCFIKKLQVL